MNKTNKCAADLKPIKWYIGQNYYATLFPAVGESNCAKPVLLKCNSVLKSNDRLLKENNYN